MDTYTNWHMIIDFLFSFKTQYSGTWVSKGSGNALPNVTPSTSDALSTSIAPSQLTEPLVLDEYSETLLEVKHFIYLLTYLCFVSKV